MPRVTSARPEKLSRSRTECRRLMDAGSACQSLPSARSKSVGESSSEVANSTESPPVASSISFSVRSERQALAPGLMAPNLRTMARAGTAGMNGPSPPVAITCQRRRTGLPALRPVTSTVMPPRSVPKGLSSNDAHRIGLANSVRRGSRRAAGMPASSARPQCMMPSSSPARNTTERAPKACGNSVRSGAPIRLAQRLRPSPAVTRFASAQPR